MRTKLLSAAMLTFVLFAQGEAAAADQPANALLVVPSDAAFDRKFQDFLEKGGAKLLHSHPPSVFIGYIPPEMDKDLREKYAAEVYRERVDDWASFARYGENAVFAVNAWNKRFLEDPPEAPLVVSAKVQKAAAKGDAIRLVWNEVMKAASYRLQISRDPEFASVELETVLGANRYTIYPSFLPDGIYYWRVAGVLRLNTGEMSEGAFSGAYSFAVSRPAAAKGLQKPRAPGIERKISVAKGALRWPNPSDSKYYRLQLSDKSDLEVPLIDVFVDTCAFKTSSLPLERGRTYYMRVMGSDGVSTGDWSQVSEVVIEPPRPVQGDMRRVRGKR